MRLQLSAQFRITTESCYLLTHALDCDKFRISKKAGKVSKYAVQMCPENRRLVKGGDKKTAELVLEQPSEGRDPGRSGRILTVTGEAICGRLSDRNTC